MENPYNIKNWAKNNWPEELLEIPQSPKSLRIRGENPDISMKRLCVVGSRKYSDYGETICKKLIEGLYGYPIVIISGLAFGIDSIAHKIAIENNIKTIAFPGSGLSDNVIYPKSHLNLANEILENDGCLLSEFDDKFEATNWAFPKRNRLMVGFSHAALIIEATEKSGSMITARMALDYNRDLLSVPGSIFGENSEGTNRLIKEGAVVIRNSGDIIEALGMDILENFNEENKINSLTTEEKIIYEYIANPIDIDELLSKNIMPIDLFNTVITSLEIKGLIQFVDGKICKK